METDSQPVDKNVQIIFEDDGLLVVNKPGNLPCHPGGSYLDNTLLHVLREKGYEGLSIVNRLDRETSGIVLLAKNPAVAKSLSNQFRNHTVRKEYTVLVHGEFPEKLRAAGWLVHDDQSVIMKKRRFVADDENIVQSPEPEGQSPEPEGQSPEPGVQSPEPEGQSPEPGVQSPKHRAQRQSQVEEPRPFREYAETEFERFSYENGISRVKAYPKTGRTHQIRATLYSLGFPVVGDKIYGLDETVFLRFISDTMTDADREKLIYRRQALHASALTVMYRNEKRSFVCEPDFLIMR